MIEDRPNAPEMGREVVRAVTVVDCPPIKVAGLRMYTSNRYGKRALTEAWTSNTEKDLSRRIKRLPKEVDTEKRISEMEGELERASNFTAIIHTMPRATGIKKIPDVMEIGLGGRTPAEKFEFARGILGNEIRIGDVFKPGEVIDIIAITKGKGFQGPVKRWGIKIRNRKTDDARRHPGTLGPWHPHQVMWTVPLGGQTGYHQRTELNKRLLRIGTSEDTVEPRGGFLRYGSLSGDYVMLAGSTPGPTKRLLNLRKASRPWKALPEDVPNLTEISVASAQGR
jgi:large subunit ribosomal protein L3